ncbi:MAG: transporter substrate-binding domain-containing protein [Candidatus Gastranaerophilales bacterium]
MFKKIVICLLFIGLFSTGCNEKKVVQNDLDRIVENEQIIVGVRTDTKPFGYLDEKGNHAGFDVDLAKMLADSILNNQDNIKFVDVNSTNRIMKLNSNEVDIIIATMTVTNNRKHVMDFSIPYHIAGQAILVNKNSDVTSIGDLKDSRIIVVYGSTSEQNLRTNLPTVKVIGYRTYEEAYQALKENKADAIMADDTLLLDYVLSNNSVKLLKSRYSTEPYAVGFRKTPESASLQQKINSQIKFLSDTGKLDRLREKHEIK